MWGAMRSAQANLSLGADWPFLPRHSANRSQAPTTASPAAKESFQKIKDSAKQYKTKFTEAEKLYTKEISDRDARIAELEAALQQIADGVWLHSVGEVSRADYDALAAELERRQELARSAFRSSPPIVNGGMRPGNNSGFEAGTR